MTSLLRILFVSITACLLETLIHAGPMGRDTHSFDSDEITPEMMLDKYPLLQTLVEQHGNVIPTDVIIRDHPDLWAKFKADPPVWRWFQKNLPQYTRDRVEGSLSKSVVKPPFKAKSPEMAFVSWCEKMLSRHPELLKQETIEPSFAVQSYMKWQEFKWGWKNYKRAAGLESGPARAWESEYLDPDYLKWFKKHGVPKKARVIDIGTELGLQTVNLAAQGYIMTGTDVGEAELEVGREYAKRKKVEVTMIRDDILNGEKSKLVNGSYDVVIDRAVFHSMMPYTRSVPILHAPVASRFAERIKSLLKKDGIFVFKGMSADEKGFRQGEVSGFKQEDMCDPSPVAMLEVASYILRNNTSDEKPSQTGGSVIANHLRWAQKQGLYKRGTDEDPGHSLLVYMQHLHKSELKKLNNFFTRCDLYPMPYHFSTAEMGDIFGQEMGFDILESGQTRFYNDKSDETLMPLAEYAIMRSREAKTEL